jgi:hypothetical protein
MDPPSEGLLALRTLCGALCVGGCGCKLLGITGEMPALPTPLPTLAKLVALPMLPAAAAPGVEQCGVLLALPLLLPGGRGLKREGCCWCGDSNVTEPCREIAATAAWGPSGKCIWRLQLAMHNRAMQRST